MMKTWTEKKRRRLNQRIKENWEKLTDEEIASYQESPDAFFNTVKEKYGMFKDDAERRINQLKSSTSLFSW